jgi:hypothetical protein
METVALRPSGPRNLCFSIMSWVWSALPAASSAAASDTDGVPVCLRTVSEGLGTLDRGQSRRRIEADLPAAHLREG